MTEETNPQAEAAAQRLAEASQAVNMMVRPMLKVHDPRAIVQALLMNATSLSTHIIAAGRWTQQDVAMEFSQAMCASLEPQEKPRIQVVDATGAPRG